LDKIIVTGFLIVAGVISAITVFNTMVPAIQQSSDAMTAMERRVDDRMKTQIEIIQAAKSGSTVIIWVKNVGSARVLAPSSADLFFGPQGNFARIPYGTGDPHWTMSIENDTEWNPSATLKITITFSTPPSAGSYFVKMVLTNGISHEYLTSW
jgi:archaellum component FlaF (FlaF/FlaG flagellin family)